MGGASTSGRQAAWVGLPLALLLLVGLRLATGGAGGPSAPVEVVPELPLEATVLSRKGWSHTSRDLVHGTQLYAAYDALGREVVLKGTNLAENHSIQGRLEESVAYDVSFTPTEARLLAPSASGDPRLLVAGVRATGAVLLEAWTLEPVEVLLTPSGHELEMPRVTRKVSLYEDALATKGVVLAAFPDLADIDHAFVLFNSPRSVERLRLSTKTLTPVVGTSGAPGTLLLPELDGDFNHFWCGDHASKGHLYVHASLGVPSPGTVVLQDQDRDGALDDAFLVDAHDWASEGYGEQSNYP